MVKKLLKNKKGSALLLTLLVITSIIVIAMGGSTLALSGIKMAGVQSQSVKAYFAAEAGAEELLYKTRKEQSIDLSASLNEIVIDSSLPDGTFYWVFMSSKVVVGGTKNIFTSLGSFLNTRRSVDLEF